MISILMPVKNAGNYLEECLQSILNQTHKDWELIAVDDHSSDNSWDILNEFSRSDSRIQIMQNGGQGIIDALKTAYSASSGDFIHRMDADDIMPTKKLKDLHQILIEKGVGTIATGKVKYFSDHGVNEGYRKYEDWLNQLCENGSHWNEIYKECVIASPCWMVYRSDFEHCGAFNSNVYPEDYDLVFRFYQKKLRVVSSNEVLHYWRDHPERTSRNHEHYAAQSFYDLKLKYFLVMDYNPSKKLVIWGAGTKGKRMAKMLKERKIPFQWASNNPNKHGKEIYEQLLMDIDQAIKGEVQVIVTVAQKDAKEEIKSLLHYNKLKENIDYWFFS